MVESLERERPLAVDDLMSPGETVGYHIQMT